MMKGSYSYFHLLLHLLTAFAYGQLSTFFSEDCSSTTGWIPQSGGTIQRTTSSDCPTSAICCKYSGFEYTIVSTVGYKDVVLNYDMSGDAVYSGYHCTLKWKSNAQGSWKQVYSMSQYGATVTGRSSTLGDKASDQDSLWIRFENDFPASDNNAYLYNCFFNNVKLKGIPFTHAPTLSPSKTPTNMPTSSPTAPPSDIPTVSSADPSAAPSEQPSEHPTTYNPSASPTDMPSQMPSEPSQTPSAPPTEGYHFTECVKDFALSDDELISIDVDITHKKMRITLELTQGVWFGIGFGNNEMSGTSGIVVSNPSGGDIKIDWRILGVHKGGNAVDDYTFEWTEKADIAASRVVSVVCDWEIGDQSNYAIYSFTDFFECSANTRTLPIIWAKGFDENFGYHGEGNRRNDMALISCNCDDDNDNGGTVTKEPSTSPTEDIDIMNNDSITSHYERGWVSCLFIMIALFSMF